MCECARDSETTDLPFDSTATHKIQKELFFTLNYLKNKFFLSLFPFLIIRGTIERFYKWVFVMLKTQWQLSVTMQQLACRKIMF